MVYLYDTRCVTSCQRGEEDLPSQNVQAYHLCMTMYADVSWESLETMGYPSEAISGHAGHVRDECEPWRGRCPMASKRSKKVRNRRKALQRWRQRSATTRRPVTQIPPENADQVAMTTTGEILQLIRLHYAVEDSEKLRTLFASLRCLEYDASQTRWVWLYTEEARTLPFKDRRAGKNVVLGEFVFKGETAVVLNLRSFERATNALVFFDHHIPRTVAHVTAMTVSNHLLSTAEAASLGSLDYYFDHAEVVIQDPASLLREVEDLVARTPDLHERFARLDQYLTDRAQAPRPPMERLPVHYYEDGIRAVEALLSIRQVIAMHHWQGDTSYTYQDMIRDMLHQGDIPPGHTRRVVQEQPSVDAPLTTQLGTLMRSEAYEDWLHAWELLRDHTPDHITTFDALETLFHLDVQDCSVTEMFYELDMALHNEGLEDARLTATRAEVARWVYSHFTEESALNLGNFRGYEAESLWELGQREQAEALFQALTETFPTFAWGYIWWGDGYWMSDWSYEHAPYYDRAEAIYRQALAIPKLEDRGDVQDRLDDLADEQAHPEKRDAIKQARLRHIQRRKSVNETP
jgi:tetratricopeptide (TPR) repeat protein